MLPPHTCVSSPFLSCKEANLRSEFKFLVSMCYLQVGCLFRMTCTCASSLYAHRGHRVHSGNCAILDRLGEMEAALNLRLVGISPANLIRVLHYWVS